MELLKSIRFFVWGIAKRIYWVLPTLILDPFDLLEKLFNVNYRMPQWSIWTLFSLGWFIAAVLTFHELRTKGISSEEGSYNENAIYSKLSNEAHILLKRAAKSQDSTIMYGKTFGGTFIQVGRIDLIANRNNLREVAKWESALSELVRFNLVSDLSGEGEIFSVSHLGYKVADKVKRK